MQNIINNAKVDGVTSIDFDEKLRLLVGDVLNNENNSSAIKILKEFFNTNTELGKENELYKILLEKFNKKYGTLGFEQKSLLKEYINNISNSDKMKSFVNGRITEVTNDIKKSSKKVNDKIIKIKLNEVTTQLNKVKKAKKVDDKSILALMRSYSLKRELKNVTK